MPSHILLSFAKSIKVLTYTATVIIAMLTSVDGRCQEDQLQTQLWFDFNPAFYLNDKLESFGDWAYRTNFNDPKWRRISGRPSLRYHYSELLEFNAGLGLFYLMNESSSNRFQLAPWQGVKLKWPNFGRLKFDHLVRIEERLFWLFDSNDQDFSPRFRYRLNAKWMLSKDEIASPWFLQGRWEGFYPIGADLEERFRNRARFSFGLGRSYNSIWTYTFLVIYQENKTAEMDEFPSSDLAFQLKIKKRIGGRK